MAVKRMETASTLSRLHAYYASLSPEEQKEFWTGLPVDVLRLWYSGRFMGMKEYKVNAGFLSLPKEKQYPAMVAWFKIMKIICPPVVPEQIYRIAYVGKSVRGKIKYKSLSPLVSWTASLKGMKAFLYKLPLNVARKKFTDPGFALLTFKPPAAAVLVTHDSVNEFAQAYVQLYRKLKPKLSKEERQDLMISLQVTVPTLRSAWGKMEEVVCFMPKGYIVEAADPKTIRNEVM